MKSLKIQSLHIAECPSWNIMCLAAPTTSSVCYVTERVKPTRSNRSSKFYLQIIINNYNKYIKINIIINTNNKCLIHTVWELDYRDYFISLLPDISCFTDSMLHGHLSIQDSISCDSGNSSYFCFVVTWLPSGLFLVQIFSQQNPFLILWN